MTSRPGPHLHRRRLLVAGAGLGLTACASVRAAAPATCAANTEPAGSLKTIVRLRGDPDQDSWLWFEGRVYGRVPDKAMQPLFGFTSILRVRYEANGPDTFLFEQRESAHFWSLETGDPIGPFKNPYTGETNIIVGYVSPIWKYRMTPEGTFSRRSGKQIGRFKPALITRPHEIRHTEYRANSFPASISAEEFPRAFRTPMRDSADLATYRARPEDVAASAFVPALTDIVADTPWPLWMFMEDRPGHAVWVGHGYKSLTLDTAPDAMKRRIEQVHPGFLDDPWAIDAAPYSTAHQMRELRRQGKI